MRGYLGKNYVRVGTVHTMSYKAYSNLVTTTCHQIQLNKIMETKFINKKIVLLFAFDVFITKRDILQKPYTCMFDAVNTLIEPGFIRNTYAVALYESSPLSLDYFRPE